MPKVSVIIPVYNQGKFLSDAIESVIAQTYKDVEIVCVNDGSTDNSKEIIESFVNKHNNILFLNETENKGVINARNIAIDLSKGEYILPLDADDSIEPTYIEKAVKILDKNPKVGIVYCKAKLFGTKNEYWDLDDFDKSDFLYKNCIFCTAMFRKKDFINVGKYKNYMKFGCEDYDLWISLIEHGFEVYRIDEILFNYRQHNGISRTTINKINNNKVWAALIKNHIDFYLQDSQFMDRFHKYSEKFKPKYVKYKKLFNKTLVISIIIIVFQLIIIARLICFQ